MDVERSSDAFGSDEVDRRTSAVRVGLLAGTLRRTSRQSPAFQ